MTTARLRERWPGGRRSRGGPVDTVRELVFAALLDGRHLWLGAEHDAGSAPPVVSVRGEVVAPSQTGGSGEHGRTSTGWRVPLGPWLADDEHPDDLVVEVHHDGRPVPSSPALDPRTSGGAEPRRTPDGRWLLTWAATARGVRVRRSSAPERAPLTSASLCSGDLVLTCTWPTASPLLLVRGDGDVVARIRTTLSGTSLSARIATGASLPVGESAGVALDTDRGPVPLARRHHDLARPGEAVVLPMLVDRAGRTGALRLRYDRDGCLLVLRTRPPGSPR